MSSPAGSEGDRLVGRGGGYHLGAVIGRGGTAEVWSARVDGDPVRAVAVRRRLAGGAASLPSPPAASGGSPRPHPDLDRAWTELVDRPAARHPSLLPVLDVVVDGDGIALVLPLAPGGSLRELLDERGSLDPTHAAAVLAPVAEAVHGLHLGGVVHGDLKPENILLDAHGRPLLTDPPTWDGVLGLGGEDPPPRGTPGYLDPARSFGSPADPRSDVFALGVVAYEALTGRPPHRGDAAQIEVAAAAGLHRPLTSWPAVPAPVAAVVEAALDPDPARRPRDARSFADALIEAARTTGPLALPGPASPRHREPSGADLAGRHRTIELAPRPEPVPATARPRRRLALVGAACAVASLALVGAGVARIADRPASPRPNPTGGPVRPGSCPTVLPTARSEVPVPPADVDGDGCPDPVRWDGRVLVVELVGGRRAFAVGRPGVQLVLGDWDGRGAATPALYDATAGSLELIERLPVRVGERAVTAPPVSVLAGGRAVVVRGGPGRADRVRIESPR